MSFQVGIGSLSVTVFFQVGLCTPLRTMVLKIDKKLYKNIDFYYISYITMKDSDYVKINSVNALYLIIGKVDGHIKEKIEINT